MNSNWASPRNSARTRCLLLFLPLSSFSLWLAFSPLSFTLPLSPLAFVSYFLMLLENLFQAVEKLLEASEGAKNHNRSQELHLYITFADLTLCQRVSRWACVARTCFEFKQNYTGWRWAAAVAQWPQEPFLPVHCVQRWTVLRFNLLDLKLLCM